MPVFRTDHLGLNNQLGCFSMGKTVSPTLSTQPVGLDIGLRLLGLPLFHMSIAAVRVQLMCRQSCQWDFMGIAFDSTSRYNLIVQSLFTEKGPSPLYQTATGDCLQRGLFCLNFHLTPNQFQCLLDTLIQTAWLTFFLVLFKYQFS